MSDGGQAFPIGSGQTPEKGMTLRDYFAAAALSDGYFQTFDGPPSEVAKQAYAIADAMIEAREER